MEVVENRVTESVLEASNGHEAQIEYVPYGRLFPSPLNVRKKAPTGIEALAETIVVKCMLQNLVVHEVKGRSKQPKLGVCAGQRRLAALDLLFSQGRITEDYRVPVLIVSEGEAVAASLIENREREAMSIADESVAFRLLTEEGKSIAHVSALFKVSEMVVRRALKIANLAPVLLDLLRDDKLDYEQAKVLALADDHATQERVWNDAHNAWQRRPSELRAAITKAEIDARDSALAKFVGLDAYEGAGGYVRRDLFSDGENAGYIADADLLHRLATDRLIEISQTVQSEEGWLWVETRTRGDANELIRYGRVHSTTRKPTKNEEAELAVLAAKRDAAHMELNAYYDEDCEEDEARHDRLSTAVDVATHAVDQYAERFEVFGPEDMQRAGAFVYLDDDGFVTIERGLIRPEERAAARGDDALPVTATGQSSKPARVTPLHNEKLCRRLTAHRTAAIQTELARHPSVALAVLMSRMIPVVFEEHYERQYPEHAIEVNLRTSRGALVKHADDMADSVAWKEIEAERVKWMRMLPARADALLPWLLGQGSDIQSNLFAFCVAATVDGIDGSDRAHAVNSLADVLNVDLSYYWKPTRASYFDHVSKSRIADVLREHVSPQAAAEVQGMKKDAAAADAEVRMAESGWLPGVLANRAVPEFRSYAWEDDDADGEADDEAHNAGADPDDVIDEAGHEAGDDHEGPAEAA